MSSNPTSYLLLMNLAKGPYLSASEVPSGYVTPPGTLVASNEVEFIFDLWENYAETGGTKLDLPIAPTAAVGKLYITLANSGVARTPLTTGVTCTISAVTGIYQRLTVSIAPGTLPTVYCCGTLTRFCFEIENSTGGVIATFFMDLQLVDAQGGYTATPSITSADEQVDVTVITATATITATPGPRTILVDPTAAAVVVTLPASNAKTPGQEITVMALNLAHTVTVRLPGSETFGGTTETDYTIEVANSAHVNVAYSNPTTPVNTWYHLNWLEILA